MGQHAPDFAFDAGELRPFLQRHFEGRARQLASPCQRLADPSAATLIAFVKQARQDTDGAEHDDLRILPGVANFRVIRAA